MNIKLGKTKTFRINILQMFHLSVNKLVMGESVTVRVMVPVSRLSVECEALESINTFICLLGCHRYDCIHVSLIFQDGKHTTKSGCIVNYIIDRYFYLVMQETSPITYILMSKETRLAVT